MRELFVGWVMLKTDLILGLIIMMVSLFTMGILIYYRFKVVKSSSDNIEKKNSLKNK